ncbi:MAG: LapA family protein [Planctomycetaceae bacterium]|nr:LapA family protein [Planctomycetales bacterium]MCB9922403.1 LapA family protein [Planctomycetaceae bacterium]
MFKGNMNKVKLVAIAVTSLLVLIVVLQNTQAVETNLLFLTVTMPNAALLFGTLIIGFALGVLTAGHIVSVEKRTVSTASDKEPRAAA